MFYTPKYCNECGGEIEQTSWKFWTNHRFCENCRDDFKAQKWMPAVWILAGSLGVIYGFGTFLKKPEKPVGLLTTSTASTAANKNQESHTQSNMQTSSNGNVQYQLQKTGANNIAIQANPTTLNSISGQKLTAVNQNLIENQQNQAAEAVYICGAQTKKGTACMRRVKGGGRCWQHSGQPAMLPAAKLLVSQ